MKLTGLNEAPFAPHHPKQAGTRNQQRIRAGFGNCDELHDISIHSQIWSGTIKISGYAYS